MARTRPKLIATTIIWWKKLVSLGKAEHRSVNEQAEALWAEALKHREQIKEFAQEHLRKDETSED